METLRGKTAIGRRGMSRPVATALQDGVISSSTSVLDYGSGRGADVRALKAADISCTGWDPVHDPDSALVEAGVVNLGYVVNVIEDPRERAETLARAWSFAQRTLVISARLKHEAAASSLTPFRDGWLTSKNTFQKFFDQDELRDWIQDVLDVPVAAAGPGIFYVFRQESDRQDYLATRVTRRRAPIPRLALRDLFERHRALLEPILEFVAEHGRAPESDEVEVSSDMVAAFGSLKSATRAVIAGIGEDAWIQARLKRSDDLLVYLGLSRLSRRPRYSDLPRTLQRDVKSLFGSYGSAVTDADQLLFSAGDMSRVRAACSACPVGKLTNTALYVHVDALDDVPAILRIYEGCARTFIGTIVDATLIKLRFDDPVVSYLAYPTFDVDPHPPLAGSIVVPLQTFRVSFRDYSKRANPPILHRKELFVPEGYPARSKFERLTRQEERWELLDETERIGTRHGWEERLEECGVRLAGHRLVRVRR